MRVAGAKAGGSGGGKTDTVHKAVLMHGPPGIGKSSSARVVIESCGYTMVELNASDVRNKAGLQEKVAFVPLALAHPLRFFHSLCWHSPEVAVAAALCCCCGGCTQLLSTCCAGVCSACAKC